MSHPFVIQVAKAFNVKPNTLNDSFGKKQNYYNIKKKKYIKYTHKCSQLESNDYVGVVML